MADSLLIALPPRRTGNTIIQPITHLYNLITLLTLNL